MVDVSVIIPSYQAALYIRQAVDSVLCQTFRSFEIIAVNDGSTDQTGEILAGFGDQVRVIHQKNLGPSAARNAGIRASSGKYIAFLDADDVWQADKLERQVAILEKDISIGLVFSDTHFFDTKGKWGNTSFQMVKPASGWVHQELFIRNFIPLLTAVIRRDCLDCTGWFDESIIGPEDYDLWLRISNLWKVDFVDVPLAAYRVSENQISRNSRRMWASVVKIKEREYSSSVDLQNLDVHILDRCYFNLYTRWAKTCLIDHCQSEAIDILKNYRSQRGATWRYWLYSFLGHIPYPLLNSSLLAGITSISAR